MAYDKSYWDYQKGIGNKIYHTQFVRSKFESKINLNDSVLDFGCGGGFVLDSLKCKRKIGIEINPFAKKQAVSLGIEVFDSFGPIKNNSVDVVISNSALEHISNPIKILKETYRVLKPNGNIIISVPHEDLSYNFEDDDINQHLFTWSPMSFGNLIQKVGFNVENVNVTKVIQPPFASFFYNLFGIKGYKIIGSLYRISRKLLIPIKRMGVSGDIIVYATKL
tara:strand:+ start:940 stop:1605 length:666 start_codon:yes stop_codon:yes gene_type:complete